MAESLKTLVKRVPLVRVVVKTTVAVVIITAMAVLLAPFWVRFPDFEEGARDAEWQSLQVGLWAMLAKNAIESVAALDNSTSSSATNNWSALPSGPGAQPLAGVYLRSVTSVYFYCYDDKARITQQFDTAEGCTKQERRRPSRNLDQEPAPALDRPFHLKINRSALIESETLELRFEAVADSRCIPLVECDYSRARASVLINAVNKNSGEEIRFVLVLWERKQGLGIENFGRHSVTLVDLLPHPTGQTIDASEYTAVLLVSGANDQSLVTRLWPF